VPILLISPVNLNEYSPILHRVIFDNYKLGWLMEFSDYVHYSVWGIAKNEAQALKIATDCLNIYEGITPLLYKLPVGKSLSLEEAKLIKENSKKLLV